MKNEAEVTLRLSSDMIANSDDETNFHQKLLLTNRQVKNLRKAFANYLSTDIKLWKLHWSKMVQSIEFLGRLLGSLPKTGLPLMTNVIKLLAKGVLIPSWLTAAASVSDAGIHKNFLRSDRPLSSILGITTLIISNYEMEDISKIV